MKKPIYHIFDVNLKEQVGIGHSILLCGLWNADHCCIDIDVLRFEPETVKDLRLCKNCLKKFKQKEVVLKG